MVTNFSLTAGGVENYHFLAMGGAVPSKFDIVIPKTPLYKGTLNSVCKEKKYAEILLCYRQLFVKGNIIVGKWGIHSTLPIMKKICGDFPSLYAAFH